MSPSLRVLASCLLTLLLLATPDVLLAQSRGRTAGQSDDDASGRTTDARSRTGSDQRARGARGSSDDAPDKRSTRSADQDAPAARQRSNQGVTRQAPATRQPSAPAQNQSDEAGGRSTRSERVDSGRSAQPTTRGDRQSGTTARPSRERSSTPAAPVPERSVDRNTDATNRNNRSATPAAPTVRGREADRAVGRARVVDPPKVIVTRPPRVRVDAAWPWEWRRQHNWSPRYRYRQRVIIDAGWMGRRHNDYVEVETTYRHRLRRADGRRAEVDVYIDRIAVYDRGRFIGEVDRIPNDLSRMRAYVYRNGRVDFDREIFLIGSLRDGFELISTRYYDRYLLNAYDRRHGYKAGYLDFRRDRVVSIRRSKFFTPYDFAGYVPLSLLPDDHRWLLDHGRGSIAGYYYDSHDARRWNDGADWDHRGWRLSNYNVATPGDYRLERQYHREITTNGGAVIGLQREEVLELLDD